MRVVVFGASGRTGKLIVSQLLAKKHKVVAAIRSAKAMAEMAKLGAETVLVDLATSPFGDIVDAVEGAEALIFAAGSAAGETSEFDRIGTRRTLQAAKKAGVKRYVSISAIGASTGMSTRSLDAEMQDYYRQKRAAGKLIGKSGLDWTLIEPSELTDDPPAGKVKAFLGPLTGEPVPISRADVAAVTVAVLGDKASYGKAIQLEGGRNLIATAVKSALK